MIFNQTEFGHIAIAMQRRLRLRWRHGRTCSGHPRLPSLKRRKQGVDGRDKRGHDDVGRCGENDPGLPRKLDGIDFVGNSKISSFCLNPCS